MSIYALWILLLSILRKRAHIPLLIALTPPIILSVTIFSVPSISNILSFLEIPDKSTILVVREPFSDKCFRVNMISVHLGSEEDLYLHTVVLVVDQVVYDEISRVIASESAMNLIADEQISISLPEHLYQELGRPRVVRLKLLNEDLEEYRVAYVHKLLNNPILILNKKSGNEPSIYLCISSAKSVLISHVARSESNLISHALTWVLLVSASHTFLIYVAIKVLSKRLEPELKTLLFMGFEPSRLALIASITVLIVSTALSLLLHSITVVVLNTVHSFVSTFTLVLKPEFRSTSILPTLLILILCCILSYTGIRRSLLYG